MSQRYIATYEYTEIVKGEHREFVHETLIEAADPTAANRIARNHYDELARHTGVTWMRSLRRLQITAAPRGAMAKGGRWVEREKELAE